MTAFEREIRAFLCVVGITKYDVFAPHYPRFFTEFERYTVSKSTMNNLYNEKYKELRQGMATKLARRLQYFLDGGATLKTPADLAERLGACGGTISFLHFEKGKFSVSIPALITLYGPPEPSSRSILIREANRRANQIERFWPSRCPHLLKRSRPSNKRG